MKIIRNFIFILTVLTLSACSSEQDKFVINCIKDSVSKASQEILAKDQRIVSMNCDSLPDLKKNYRFSLQNIYLDRSCETDKDKYPFYPAAGRSSQFKNEMPTIKLNEADINCDECTVFDKEFRRPVCSDEALAACWSADEKICNTRKKMMIEELQSQCIEAKNEVSKRGVGALKINEQEYREACLKRISN